MAKTQKRICKPRRTKTVESVKYFNKSKRNGMVRYTDGSIFRGTMKNGHPVKGTITYMSHGDGDVGKPHTYTGQVYDGYRHGKGTYTFPSGAKYIGNFNMSRFHGKSKYIYKKNKTSGNYKCDAKDGKWKETFHNEYVLHSSTGSSSSFVGNYKNNYRTRGTYTNKHKKYTGEYEDSLYNGKGTLEYKNGEKYEGNFNDGKYNGDGVLTYPKTDTRLKFEGVFYDGKANGLGKLTYKNGDVLKAWFIHGDPNGEATKYDKHGKVIAKGTYTNGGLNGHGMVTYKNGDVYEGAFVNGIANGKGTVYDAKGKKIVSGVFQNGHYIAST